jgi:hypothetical protein
VVGDDVERALALGDFAPPPLAPNHEAIDGDIDADPRVSKRVPSHASKKRVNASSSVPFHAVYRSGEVRMT